MDSKPKNHPNSIILNQLLALSSQSNNPEKAVSCLKTIIENIHLCQKNRLVNPDEMKELEEIEEELQGSLTNYKNEGNKKLVKRYVQDVILLLFGLIVIVSVVIALIYIHCYLQRLPNTLMETISLTIVILLVIFGCLVLGVQYLVLLRFKLYPVEDTSNRKNRQDSTQSNEQNTLISTKMLMNQQLKLVNYYSKTVEPFRRYVKEPVCSINKPTLFGEICKNALTKTTQFFQQTDATINLEPPKKVPIETEDTLISLHSQLEKLLQKSDDWKTQAMNNDILIKSMSEMQQQMKEMTENMKEPMGDFAILPLFKNTYV